MKYEMAALLVVSASLSAFGIAMNKRAHDKGKIEGCQILFNAFATPLANAKCSLQDNKLVVSYINQETGQEVKEGIE